MTNSSKVSNYIFYGILVILVLEYINLNQYFPFLKVLRLGTVLVVVLNLMWLFSGEKDSISLTQTKIFVALTIVVLFSIFISLVTMTAVEQFKAFFGYFLLYLLIINSVLDEQKMKKFLAVFIFVHLVVILMTPEIIGGARENVIYMKGGYFLGDGNDFSLSLIIVIPFTLYLIKNSSGMIGKLYYFSVFLIFTASLILIASRASFIGFVIVIIYLTLRGRNKIIAIFLLLLVVVGFTIMAPESYSERMQSIYEYQEDTSAMGRLRAWGAGISMFLDNPLGVGAGNFSSVFGRFYQSSFSSIGWASGRWISPHSMYIQCLAELGAVGTALLLYLIFVNIKTSRTIKNDDRPENEKNKILINFTMAGFFGYLVNAAFLGVLYYPHLFVVTGIIGAVYKMSQYDFLLNPYEQNQVFAE